MPLGRALSEGTYSLRIHQRVPVGDSSHKAVALYGHWVIYSHFFALASLRSGPQADSRLAVGVIDATCHQDLVTTNDSEANDDGAK